MLNSGIIVIWSGSIGNIPAGYVLCDGDEGSPDLTDRFVIGAGDSYDVNDTGGSKDHDHEFTGDGHTHDINAGEDIGEGTTYSLTTDIEAVTGTTDETETLPPYYALAFIMKV